MYQPVGDGIQILKLSQLAFLPKPNFFFRPLRSANQSRDEEYSSFSRRRPAGLSRALWTLRVRRTFERGERKVCFEDWDLE
jgi:hypothetical protein